MADTTQSLEPSRSIASIAEPTVPQPGIPSEHLTSDDEELLSRLSSHKTIGGAPREELVWLLARGHFERFPPGQTVSRSSMPVAAMYVILSGRVSIHVVRGETRHKIAEWRAGDVTGALPYSRLVSPPGDTVVEEAADVFAVPREVLPEMTRECHELTSLLVHVMLDRARFFTSTFLHDEKLKSLGKLAAGLAHELNNPAAAITRFAKTLPGCLEDAEAAARALGATPLTREETAALRRLTDECSGTRWRSVPSPFEEAERETAFADWLQRHGLGEELVDVITQSPMTLAALDRLAQSIRPDVLEPVLRSVAADCSARDLARQIEQAATRISDLIKAVKGFTQLDASAAPQPVDVAQGLEQTLAVLRGKARGKSVGMEIAVEEQLPRVRGVAAEINQIWANLIDNAIDAAPVGGRVDVDARRERDHVVVRVIDNGTGISPDVLGHIFEPFFTTKDVGKGTGLGLDIVRRLVDRHSGDIEVQSVPGHTEFIVSLPVADVRSPGGPRG